VVLNYNGGEHVLASLRALRATDWPDGELDVVVVDNASTDGSDAAIEAGFPDVQLRRSPENVGFPANNLALGDLEGVDYVALVNNDAFVDPGWLGPLVGELERDPRLGAACPRILLAPAFAVVELEAPAAPAGAGDGRALGVRLYGADLEGVDVLDRVGGAVYGPEQDGQGRTFRWTAPDGSIALPVDSGTGPWDVALELEPEVAGTVVIEADGSRRAADLAAGERGRFELSIVGPGRDVINNVGSVVLSDGSGADRGFQQLDGPEFDEPADVFAWCGAAVLLRPRMLEAVGLFDERFFLYYEDTDLSWRGRMYGWQYRYVPGSLVRHLHAASSVEGSPLFRHFVERNRLLMLAKNAPRGLAIAAPLRFLGSTASYARRDVLTRLVRGRRPHLGIVRARLRSFGAFCRLLPAMVRDRRGIRSRATVSDAEIESQLSVSARVGPR